MNYLKNKFCQPQFDIRVSVLKDKLYDIENSICIKQILSSRSFFKLHPIVINADPFLFVDGKSLYLFYEEQKELRGKGLIKMIKTSDMIKWTNPIIVLEEEFHLSYPNVFRDGSNVYMIPESGQNLSISLYKPNFNFTKWTHYKTLLEGENYVDSSIFYKSNTYYLFTTILRDGGYSLMLYYADTVDGVWEKHPISPISTDKNEARCGGAIFKYQNKTYRPAQILANYYGEGLSVYQIEELSKDKYIEKKIIEKFLPNNNNEHFKQGGHHLNVVTFQNKLVIANDVLSYQINYWEICKRILAKLNNKKKLLH